MVNERINTIYKNYCDNKLSHSFLIETNIIERCLNDVVNLVKKIECENNCFKEDCFMCNKCTLIAENSFPGLIIVRPEGKIIKKEHIDNIKNTFVMKPVYSKYNTYIILNPEFMNATAFNRLLKFLEEPEDNILAFFITENINFVPPTIVSRCEVVRCIYKDIADNNLYNEYIKSYDKLICEKNFDILWYNENVLLDILKERQQVILFLKELLRYYLDKQSNISIHVCQVINKYIQRIGYNVNIALFLNSFAVELLDYE